MLSDHVDRGVLVTPCTRKGRTSAHVRPYTAMLSMATEAFEVVGWTHRQATAWHQANVFLADVESAMWIVLDITMAIDTSAVRWSAPGAMACSAVSAKLLMSGQQCARLVTGTRRQQQQANGG